MAENTPEPQKPKCEKCGEPLEPGLETGKLVHCGGNPNCRDENEEHIIMEMPKLISKVGDYSEEMREKYVYTNKRIYLEKIKHTRKTEKSESMEINEKSDVLTGHLKIRTKVEFEDLDEENKNKWGITFKGREFVGNIDQLVDFLYFNGNVLCTKEEMKRIIAHILTNMRDIEIKRVYPAIGIHKTNEEIIFAVGKDTVQPLQDSQDTYYKSFTYAMKNTDDEETREILEQTIAFIDSMPDVNKYSSLISRGYACIAPLGFVIKQTNINVFPYLYLYGMKGSSKTQMADVVATYSFGEREHLSGDVVESAFRLGMEFSSTTMPRVIDEAHDVFVKNLSIFKTGATSTLATKRGNKDRTMDKYAAYCPFIFTSNMMPIAAEEDSQGSVMDRVVVVECKSGRDFDKDKYQKSVNILIKKSSIFGKKLLEFLKKKTENGIEPVIKEIIDLSDIFLSLEGNLTLRRSYCLAEIVLGIKYYFELLQNNALLPPFHFKDDKTLCEMVYYKIQEEIKTDEYLKMSNFIEWVIATSRDEKESTKSGIYIGNVKIPIPNSLHDETLEVILISTNTFSKYKQQFQLKDKPYGKLTELQKDLDRIGYSRAKPTKYYDNSLRQVWAIAIERKEYYSKVGGFIFDESTSENA